MITISVWSDYVCPWCYIGLTEVERLKSRWNFTIDWRPYLLRADTPEEGSPLPDHVKTFLANPNNPLVTRAKSLGLTMVLDRLIVPSTRRAHQAAAWAKTQGRFEPMHHALLQRYWTRGENIHEWSVLRAAATEVGLDADELQRAVESKAFVPVLQAGLDEAATMGVTAVPTFVVDNQFAVQGAQTGDVFERIFTRLGHAPSK